MHAFVYASFVYVLTDCNGSAKFILPFYSPPLIRWRTLATSTGTLRITACSVEFSADFLVRLGKTPPKKTALVSGALHKRAAQHDKFDSVAVSECMPFLLSRKWWPIYSLAATDFCSSVMCSTPSNPFTYSTRSAHARTAATSALARGFRLTFGRRHTRAAPVKTIAEHDVLQ